VVQPVENNNQRKQRDLRLAVVRLFAIMDGMGADIPQLPHDLTQRIKLSRRYPFTGKVADQLL
jgi:hypothetical protein